MYKIMITGHRPSKLGGYADDNPAKIMVKRWMYNMLVVMKERHGEIELISGMALGVDQWFAETAVEMDIPFHAYVPCRGQEKVWPRESQEHYKDLLGKAKSVVMVHDGPYNRTCMQDRNVRMIKDSDLCLGVWDGSGGGTANCLKAAEEADCKTTILRMSKKE